MMVSLPPPPATGAIVAMVIATSPAPVVTAPAPPVALPSGFMLLTTTCASRKISVLRPTWWMPGRLTGILIPIVERVFMRHQLPWRWWLWWPANLITSIVSIICCCCVALRLGAGTSATSGICLLMARMPTVPPTLPAVTGLVSSLYREDDIGLPLCNQFPTLSWWLHVLTNVPRPNFFSTDRSSKPPALKIRTISLVPKENINLRS
mmetsp:Transcript_156208/g.288067  ORF Transcript_156208/g.288067 Transcript_156208/m.288067 type:complete len:207 (-) Transcript_156208:327-947(-)